METNIVAKTTYFNLLPKHLRAYFCTNFIDEEYTRISDRLLDLNFSENHTMFEVINYAAKHGYTSILDGVIRTEPPPDYIPETACAYGQTCVLEWLATKTVLDPKICAIDAAKHNQVVILEWLELNLPGFVQHYGHKLMKHAIKNGSLECLIWLGDHGVTLTRKHSKLAALHEQLDVLKWLTKNGPYNHEKLLLLSDLADSSSIGEYLLTL